MPNENATKGILWNSPIEEVGLCPQTCMTDRTVIHSHAVRIQVKFIYSPTPSVTSASSASQSPTLSSHHIFSSSPSIDGASSTASPIDGPSSEVGCRGPHEPSTTCSPSCLLRTLRAGNGGGCSPGGLEEAARILGMKSVETTVRKAILADKGGVEIVVEHASAADTRCER